jgi:signal transduction histidine kinase
MTEERNGSARADVSMERLLAAGLGTDHETVLASLPHGLLIGDRVGLIRANQPALRLLDLDSAPLGASVLQLIAASRLAHSQAGAPVAAAEHPFAQALLGRSATCDATLDDRATDRRLCLRCHGVPLRRAGVLVGAMVTYVDVTELRRNTEVLNRTNQELREFTAVLAHDLREPLRLISNFLELVGRNESVRADALAQRYVSFSAHGAQRMRALIDDLLTLTHNGRPLRRSCTDVGAVVREALENLALTMSEHRAEVLFPDLPTIYADRAQLLLVFQNLLSNAARYAHPTRPLCITITGERREGDTLFTVADNGVGVAPETCQRIIAAFHRLEAKDDASGAGMGLAICKRVVARHGGDIWVEAGLAEGAVFKFTIPHAAHGGALEPNRRVLGA